MSVARLLRRAILVGLAMACGSDGVSAPFGDLLHAAATFQCGPLDGPATGIFLAPDPVESIQPRTPFVRIFVPVAVEELSGRVWQISDGNSEAAAWFHSTAANTELATRGYVIVSSVGSDKTVTGSVNLTFPSAGHVKGGFRAAWIPSSFLCG